MDKYWFEDLNILIDMNRLNEFIPNSSMNYVQKVNTLVRASIYVGIIFAFCRKNYLFLYIPIMTMLLTYILYNFKKVNEDTDKKIKKMIEEDESMPINDNNVDKKLDTKLKENFESQKCFAPKEENPFMNALPFDKRARSNACYLNEETNNKVETLFSQNLFREAGDIFNKQHGQRQFYTMPVTTIPNEQGKFANWLYKSPPTCKESNGLACIKNNYEHLKDSKVRNGIF